MDKKRFSPRWVLALSLVVLVLSLIGSVVLGRYPIGLKSLGGILLGQLVPITPYWTATEQSLFLLHRLPRILLACMVGASLSSSGACYQGIFQNPMAAPDILGASSGAAFGAALAILLGQPNTMIMLFAFVGGLSTMALVIFMGSRTRGKRALGLILSGIMVGSLVSSGTSFIKLVADPDDKLPTITYWLMGSLNGVSPQEVGFAALPMLIGFVPLFLLRWRMNLLSLGDEQARTMGVSVQRLRLVLIACATLLTAASVAVSGVIGWVGLVIPHFARRSVGNDYRVLLPTSALFGAIFLLLVDDVSRNLLQTEIPLGILTSLIGAPFFLYLITRDGEAI